MKKLKLFKYNAKLNNELQVLIDSVSSDQTRPQLCGVFFDFENKVAVGCDGHRLAVSELVYSYFSSQISESVIAAPKALIDGIVAKLPDAIGMKYPSYKNIMVNKSQFKSYDCVTLPVTLNIKTSKPSTVFFTMLDKPIVSLDRLPNALFTSDSKPIMLGLNPEYLTEISSLMNDEKSDSFKMFYRDHLSPVQFSADGFDYLVMPVRI